LSFIHQYSTDMHRKYTLVICSGHFGHSLLKVIILVYKIVNVSYIVFETSFFFF